MFVNRNRGRGIDHKIEAHLTLSEAQVLAYALRLFCEQMNANGGDMKGREYARQMEQLRKGIVEAM